IAGADEDGVDARRGGNGVDVIEGGGFFDDADSHDLLVGGVIVVAGPGPGADGRAGSRSALTEWRIAAGSGGAGGLAGGGSEGKDHPMHALIENALRGPQFDHGD